jgi:hypothetical protein
MSRGDESLPHSHVTEPTAGLIQYVSWYCVVVGLPYIFSPTMSRILGEGEENFYMFLVILFDKTANNKVAN